MIGPSLYVLIKMRALRWFDASNVVRFNMGFVGYDKPLLS